jgi:hypothetical protein
LLLLLLLHIMLRDSLTQKCVHKKRLLISDTPEHVDSENIKFLIGRRSLLYQLFKKRDFYFINVAKIGKNGKNLIFLNVIVLKLF